MDKILRIYETLKNDKNVLAILAQRDENAVTFWTSDACNDWNREDKGLEDDTIHEIHKLGGSICTVTSEGRYNEYVVALE